MKGNVLIMFHTQVSTIASSEVKLKLVLEYSDV